MYDQDKNTAKLILNTFHKLSTKGAVSANQIARFLQEKYGNVWKINILVGKAEKTLRDGSVLGFLEKRGDRYLSNLVREARCRCRRRRRRRCRRRRRRRRRSCRRRRRRRSCSC